MPRSENPYEVNSKFEGWMGEDERSAEGNIGWKEYEPKNWEETDVDIRITHLWYLRL